jgi:phosphatidylglycerol lysyltransferase
MTEHSLPETHTNKRTYNVALIISILVALNGIYILGSVLVEQIAVHRGSRLNDVQVDIPLLVGLSVLYLSTLLRRQKRTAWLVTIMAYAFYFGVGFLQFLSHTGQRNIHAHVILRVVVFPLVLIALLLIYQNEFFVKSDVQGFRVAARFSVIILLIAFLYGVIGFQLLDQSDFHQEINLPESIHYTIDQFNITTSKPLVPYTKRAHLFDDSLSFISLGAVIYAVLALFQPIRSRYGDQTSARELMRTLMVRYGAPSEEFFKIWPHDKQYYFDKTGESGIAFHSYRGVALCVSDPIGNPAKFPSLMKDFRGLCFNNDWLPSFIHVSDDYRKLYEDNGFTLQKLGQEAVVKLEKFNQEEANNKYFRQIRNKFQKQGYTCELLHAPHHQAVLDRLHAISSEWLSQGGRAERGFAMGYYTTEYMQMCEILVARDAAGTIQGFVNIVPVEFDTEEATYDLLRNSQSSLGNINDYLLMNLIEKLHAEGFQRLNMGLAPLGGMKKDDEDEEERTLIDNLMHFAYANGDRFYSFSGLYRFKSKYGPEWQDRYIAYQEGMRGFSRSVTALTRCMRKVVKRPS